MATGRGTKWKPNKSKLGNTRSPAAKLGTRKKKKLGKHRSTSEKGAARHGGAFQIKITKQQKKSQNYNNRKEPLGYNRPTGRDPVDAVDQTTKKLGKTR